MLYGEGLCACDRVVCYSRAVERSFRLSALYQQGYRFNWLDSERLHEPRLPYPVPHTFPEDFRTHLFQPDPGQPVAHIPEFGSAGLGQGISFVRVEFVVSYRCLDM